MQEIGCKFVAHFVIFFTAIYAYSLKFKEKEYF